MSYLHSNSASEIEAANNAEGWELSFIRLKPGLFKGEFYSALHDDVAVFSDRFTGDVHIIGPSAPGVLSIGYFYRVNEHTRWLGRPIKAGELVFGHHTKSGIDLVTGPNFRSDTALLSLEALQKTADRLQYDGLANFTSLPESLTPTPEQSRRFQAVFRTLLNPGAPPMQVIEFQSMLLTLVCEIQAQGQGQIDLLNERTIADCVRGAREAREYLESHIEHPIQTDQLCKKARLSPRQLQRGFRHVYGVSPMEYVKLCRLHRVRHQLLKNNRRTSVTQVALHYGFSHLSRFSRSYLQQFGELPRQTMKSTISG